MVPTPHNVINLVQEISRAGRDGKGSVAMVLCNSYNLRICEPEVKAGVTSTNCRRLAMLKKTHTFCNICASKCSCGNCSSLLLENLFGSSKLESISNGRY